MSNIYSEMGRFLQEAVSIDDTFKKPIKTTLNEAIDPAKRDFLNRMYRKPFYAITDECFWLDEDGNTHDVPREWLEEWFDICLERLYGDKQEAPINEDIEDDVVFDMELAISEDDIPQVKKTLRRYGIQLDSVTPNASGFNCEAKLVGKKSQIKKWVIKYGFDSSVEEAKEFYPELFESLNESINNFKDPIKLKVQIKAGPKLEPSTLNRSHVTKYYANMFNELANQPIKPEILVDNQDGSGEICFPGRDDLIDIIKSQFEKKHEYHTVEII